MMRYWPAAVLLTVAVFALAGEPPDDAASTSAEKQQLAKIQRLVGAWRGAGQPQRGSSRGSWVEEADWAWQFDQHSPALVAKLPKGKYFRALRLEADEREGDGDEKPRNRFVLTATTPDAGEPIRYRGQLGDDERLVLQADKPPEGYPAQVTFRFVAGGDRLLVLLERQAPSGQFVRLAEVGYTREGSGFGRGVPGRECVVTGGAGTIEVTHEGKTYYVCCTGCRDYFNDNPAEVLAEYAARKAEEKRK